jgi:hypothetical protein
MPAKIITVRAKTKEELKKQVSKEIKEAAKKGLTYISQGYSDNRVKKIKGAYEIDLTVHS